MYCIHCGKEIVGGEAFCMGCGSPIKKAESKKKSDKGLLGLILCIVAILYTLLSLIYLGNVQSEFQYESSSYRMGFAFGYVIIQTALATTSLCLSISENKNNKNGFSIAGFWLSIATFILLALIFVYIIAY